VKQVQRHIRSGCTRVVKVDLAKFFDSAHHDVLMSRVARKVPDRRVLRLIGRYLRADVMVDGVLQPVEVGTPQGGPLSPLLANILLDDLDKELERRQLRFTRYADDFVVMVRSDEAGHRVKASVTRWLRRQLRLEVNESKSKVLRKEHCEFLGFGFAGAKAVLSSQALSRFRQRVSELTGRGFSMSWERRLRDLNAYLRGWMNYFGLCQLKGLWRPLDEWIRRRLRACLLKLRRTRRSRVRLLMSLGAPRHLAVRAGASRRGPWRSSQLPGVSVAFPTKWFDAQGLVRLNSEWEGLAPLRRTA
jgi:RNA-directed DNA polymerase